MDTSILNSDPAFSGWCWTINDSMVKVCNKVNPSNRCLIILQIKNFKDIETTVQKAKEEIIKHNKIEALKNPW